MDKHGIGENCLLAITNCERVVFFMTNCGFGIRWIMLRYHGIKQISLLCYSYFKKGGVPKGVDIVCER